MTENSPPRRTQRTRRVTLFSAGLFLCVLRVLCGGELAEAQIGAAPLTAENWPQWRGPLLNGLSAETNLPVRWSQTENIAWKLALPAWSGSTPIVWGDRIFLNVAEGRNLWLWCVDRARGAVALNSLDELVILRATFGGSGGADSHSGQDRC